MIMKGISASIIVPVYNDASGLITTLNSLATHVGHPHTEVIVCNDGGGQLISEIAERFGATIANLETNRGRSCARNAGLKIASGDIIIFLDADQEVTTKWFSAGLSALEKSDYAGGKIEISFFNQEDIWQLKDHLYSCFSVESCLENLQFAPTANLFVRRSVIDTVGGFDERLLSSEDVDFGQRAYRAGFKLSYADTAITIHPARGKHEQLRKMVRHGRGIADKLFYIDERSRPFIALYALACLIKIPIEFLFRGAKELVKHSHWSLRIRLIALSIDKYCKAVTIFHVLMQTLVVHGKTKRS